MTPTDFLTKNEACDDGHNYAMGFQTMAEVWDNCPRGDWLLWILDKMEITPQRELRLFACRCAEQTKPTDPQSLNAIAVARRFAMGESTREELSEAHAAAYAAYAAHAAAAYAAAHAAAHAAHAAAYEAAAYAAAVHAAAAHAAAYAAYEAAAYAAAVHAAAAHAATRQAQADHLRTLIANPFT
jgi:hypothetical protein